MKRAQGQLQSGFIAVDIFTYCPYCDDHASHKIHYIKSVFPCVKPYDSICMPPSGGPKALLKSPKCISFKQQHFNNTQAIHVL